MKAPIPLFDEFHMEKNNESREAKEKLVELLSQILVCCGSLNVFPILVVLLYKMVEDDHFRLDVVTYHAYVDIESHSYPSLGT